MTDHDLLIQLIGQMEGLKLMMTNHLHHHLMYTLTLIGAFVSTTTAFVLYCLKSRVSSRQKE